MPLLQEIKMNSSEFKPMKEFLLVKPQEVNHVEKTSSGIIISSEKSILHRPNSGTVLAVGEEVNTVSVGDYVVFPDTDGIDVKFLDSVENEPNFLLLRLNSVIGKKS